MNTRKHNTRRLLVLAYSNSCKCSDLGVPAPYGRNIAPTRVYHRLGRLIGESQERVLQGRSPCLGMWVCPPRQRSPFFWPIEGSRGMRSTSSWS